MNNILFICYGNICRSPMAEMIFKDLVRNNHKNYMFSCKSRATSMEELGNDMYPDAKEILSLNNVTIEKHIAKQVSIDDINSAQYVIVMEDRNKEDLIRMFGDSIIDKIHLLLEYANGGEIEDPWYTGNFSKVYKQINEGCIGLYEYIIRRESNEV